MKKVLSAKYEDRPIKIGNLEIACAVLEDGTRVLSQRSIIEALGRGNPAGGTSKKSGDDKLPSFLSAKNLKPFIDADFSASMSIIEYKPLHGGRTAYGIKAELFPKICEVWLKARDAYALAPQQKATAEKADILMRGLAHVGIIALVDEATGYQDHRVGDALNAILEKFLINEAKKYKVTFPLQFYKMIFKLNGWAWTPQSAQKKPQIVARWTNDLVYDRLAPGLLEELEERNPKVESGRRLYKHFQFLSETVGEPRLLEHFGGLFALGRVAPNWRKFKDMVERVYPKNGENLMLDMDIE